MFVTITLATSVHSAICQQGLQQDTNIVKFSYLHKLCLHGQGRCEHSNEHLGSIKG